MVAGEMAKTKTLTTVAVMFVLLNSTAASGQLWTVNVPDNLKPAGNEELILVLSASGVAPTSGCSPATLGTQARVNYTADYYLFTAR